MTFVYKMIPLNRKENKMECSKNGPFPVLSTTLGSIQSENREIYISECKQSEPTHYNEEAYESCL